MSAVEAAVEKAVAGEYDAIRAINWSSLKYLAVSAQLYRWRLTHPEPRKPSFVFGGALHCKVLEPEKFDKRFAVYDGIRRSKEWERWQAINPGVESLKPHELERVEAVAKAVLDDPEAKKLLRGGRREEALTWTDEETGLACKGRLDYIRPDLILDLKTTRNPAPAKFERATFEYGYQAQGAFYHDGAVQRRCIDGKQNPFIIAAQTTEPFHVVVFQLTDEALADGRREYRRLLRQLVMCTDADYWPGLATGVQPLTVPPWRAASQGFSVEESENF